MTTFRKLTKREQSAKERYGIPALIADRHGETYVLTAVDTAEETATYRHRDGRPFAFGWTDARDMSA